MVQFILGLSIHLFFSFFFFFWIFILSFYVWIWVRRSIQLRLLGNYWKICFFLPQSLLDDFFFEELTYIIINLDFFGIIYHSGVKIINSSRNNLVLQLFMLMSLPFMEIDQAINTNFIWLAFSKFPTVF